MKISKYIIFFLGFLSLSGTFQAETWKKFNNYNTILPEDLYYSLAIDSNGYKWITTSLGLYRVKNHNWTIFNTENSGLKSNVLSNIKVDKYNKKWICSDSGLFVFNDTTWQVYNSENSGFFYKPSRIYFTPSNKIWLSVGRSLYLYDFKEWVRFDTTSLGKNLSKHINFLYEEEGGAYWLNSDSGLVRIFPDGTRYIFGRGLTPLPLGDVYCMVIGSDSTKWFGTSKGVFKYKLGEWVNYTNMNSGLCGRYTVYDLAFDKKNTLWIGMGCVSSFKDGKWFSLNEVIDVPYSGQYITIDKNNDKWFTGIASFANIVLYNEDGITNDFSPVEELDMGFGSQPLSCYPNPITSEGRIIFETKKNDYVSITLCDLFGREILTILKNDFIEAGTHGIQFSSKNIPSGFYNCILKYSDRIETLKVVKVTN